VSLYIGGELWTIAMIGFALSADAFSLGLGLGAQGLRWRDVAQLTIAISLLHVLFPLLSIWVGEMLHELFGNVVQQIAALIMMILGSKMTIEAIARTENGRQAPIRAGTWRLWLFACTVSLDALSVGFSLGTVRVPPLFSALTFGLLSGGIALAGLYLGKKVSQSLGEYGQIAGGAVLVILGLRFFW